MKVIALSDIPIGYHQTVNTWINNIPLLKKSDMNDLSWVVKHHKKINNYIEKKITKNGKEVNRSNETLRSHFNVLAQIAKMMDRIDIYVVFLLKVDKLVKKLNK